MKIVHKYSRHNYLGIVGVHQFQLTGSQSDWVPSHDWYQLEWEPSQDWVSSHDWVPSRTGTSSPVKSGTGAPLRHRSSMEYNQCVIFMTSVQSIRCQDASSHRSFSKS
jgi:hypothetical protein